jgi:hypothetical protein
MVANALRPQDFDPMMCGLQLHFRQKTSIKLSFVHEARVA